MELNTLYTLPIELEQFIGIKYLEKLPLKYKRYKCPICFKAGFIEKVCPSCGNDKTIIMCPLDHCHCSHEITETLAYCPICGEAVCPECGCHDVFQLSRVTGYIQDVAGWGAGKQQELKDRHRVHLATTEPDNEEIPDKRF